MSGTPTTKVPHSLLGRCAALALAATTLLACGSGDSEAMSGAGGTNSGSGGNGGGTRTRDIWVNAYYPGWTSNRLRPEQLDFEAITHITHFAWLPTEDGGIDDVRNSVTASAAQPVIQAAHAAGKKVLIAVGGAGDGSTHFPAAISDANRAKFVDTLVSEAVARGYDGIDIDMEPIRSESVTAFRQFSRDLRAAIDATAPELLMTAAALGASSSVFGPVGDVYDQINIMTYDLVFGPNVSWHNSPLSGGRGQFYSADRAASEFSRAGVPNESLGIGIDFSGYVFMGAQEPRQPFEDRSGRTSYLRVMSQYYSEQALRWDETAQAPYLSIADPPTFVTYENEQSIDLKINFVFDQGYGGVIVWEPSAAFDRSSPVDQQHPLLNAVKTAIRGE